METKLPVGCLGLVSLVFCLFLASACNERSASSKESSAESAADPAAARAAIQASLAEYETIRAALADDNAQPIGAHAQKLVDSAARAAQSSNPVQRPHLEGMAAAASALKEKAAGEIGEMRDAFGEVSRHLVALAVAEPSLQEGLYVFSCPMAGNYKKWVQRNDVIANPYMGKKMLQCGGLSKWS